MGAEKAKIEQQTNNTTAYSLSLQKIQDSIRSFSTYYSNSIDLPKYISSVFSNNSDLINNLLSFTSTSDTAKSLVRITDSLSPIIQRIQTATDWQNSLTQIFSTIQQTRLPENIGTITKLAEMLAQIDSVAYIRSYPSNIQRSGILAKKGKLIDLELKEGIALYYVIRTELIDELAIAGSTHHRRIVLAHSLNYIIEDCRGAIKKSKNRQESEEEESLIQLLQEALDVIAEKHLASGEALLAGILSHLIDLLKKPESELYRKLKSARETENPKTLDKVTKTTSISSIIAIAPIPAAMQGYAYGKTPIPTTFSRHAIAHHPNKQQFTPANAAQGLLLITSLMSYIFGWEER